MRVVFTASALLFLFSATAGARTAHTVLEIPVDTAVEPVTVEIVTRGLEQAAREHAELVIIRLNTPGGLMDSMREIISRLEASPVPVATYVAPSGGRAASAGFFLLQAGDVAAMAPGTNTGAAHPVQMGGGQMDPVMKEKVENDAAAGLRSMTSKRGRNSELAESTVRQSKSFTEREAKDGRLIEIIARDEADLLRQLDGRTVTRFNGATVTLRLADADIIPFQLSLRQKTLVILTDPNLALILLVLGGLGIYMEFNAPGMILPGVAGAICGVLALASLSVLPISFLGAALILLAAVFFALEMKFTSHGVLGVGGAIALALGSMLLVDGPIPELRIHWATALGIVLPFGLITTFLVVIAARARRNKAVMGPGAMIGTLGVAVEDLNPAGRVFAHGEYWTASSPSPVKSGDKIRVVAMDGLVLKVERTGDL